MLLDGALFLGVGLFAYVVINPFAVVLAPASVGVRHFVLFWRTIPIGKRPFSTGALRLAVFLGGAPLALAFVLNYLRPDLMQAMLDHVFGYHLVTMTSLLCEGGPAILLGSVAVTPAPRKVLVTRIAASFAFTFCFLPAIAAVLFGPVVFAFMFGNVAG